MRRDRDPFYVPFLAAIVRMVARFLVHRYERSERRRELARLRRMLRYRGAA